MLAKYISAISGLGWSTYLGSVWESLETTFAFNWFNQESHDKVFSSSDLKESSILPDLNDPTLLIDAMKEAYLKVDSFEKGLKKKKKGQKYLPTPTVIASRLNHDMMFEKMKSLKMDDFNALIRDFSEEGDDIPDTASDEDSDDEEEKASVPVELNAL